MQKKHRFNCLVVIAMGVLIMGPVYGQQHFSPVANTGEYSIIVIQVATIANTIPQVGDEIGVFDNALCVGAAVYDGAFPLSCPAVMEFIPPAGESLPGAIHGNPMTFRIWQKGSDSEMATLPTFITGGNFGDVLTVVNPLQGYSTDVEDVLTVVSDFDLAQNYPNPFNPWTQISFSIPRSSHTRIEIFNVIGERVRLLVDRTMAAGIHTVSWDGNNDQSCRVESGVYLMRMQSGDYSKTRQLHLVQ